MNLPPSTSEDHGIEQIRDSDLNIYSIGISTAGLAEVRMAKKNPKIKITATTIDPQGAKTTKQKFIDEGVSHQIEVKVEDIRNPLPYPNNTFDFIYARLILHYLSKMALLKALDELYRILKPGGIFFLVVRSTECDDAKAENSTFDPCTGLTTCIDREGKPYQRYFHTEDTIQKHLIDAGFTIDHITTYQEQLYWDFNRTDKTAWQDSLIEVLATISM